MVKFMLFFSHESFNFGAPGSHQGGAIGPGKASSGGVDGDKDRGLIAGFGGPAAGTGKRFVWAESHDSGAMDSRSEPRGNPGSDTGAPTWPSDSTNAGGEGTVGAASGKESSGIWLIQGCLGWANAGGTCKGTFWGEAESATGAVLAAPVGLQPKEGQLCLSTGPCQRFP